MDIKETVKSQFYASLEMLKHAITECPESLWLSTEYKTPYWHIAYHVLFFAHLYLHPSEDDFVPWEKHKQAYISLRPSEERTEPLKPFSKSEILAYHDLCCAQVEERIMSLDLEAESGFDWLPFNKFELQIYNIRHIQQHTGELYERLGTREDIELAWVGMKPD